MKEKECKEKLSRKTIRKQTTIKAYAACHCSGCNCVIAPSETTASSGAYSRVSNNAGNAG